jgi:putative ABC transport system permease protein
MLSLYRTLSLRYLSRRWFRALLIVASIMLGVATLVATQALSGTMSRASIASSNPIAGVVDLIVTNGDFPIDRELAKDIAGVPGVKDVHLKIYDQVKLIMGGKKQLVMMMGIDLKKDVNKNDEFAKQFELTPDIKEVTDNYVRALVFLETPAILGKELDSILAQEPKHMLLGFTILQLEKDGKQHRVVRIASLEPKIKGGDLEAFGGHVVILDLDSAAQVLGLKNKVRRIDVVLAPGVDPKKAREDVKIALRGRAEVRTVEEQNEALQSAMVGMKTGFSMCGLAALIVGMFLVYNSLSVAVAERRHEIGILLALGATRDQVWRLFAGEAFVLGIVGSALGIPLGLGLAYLGLQPVQDAISELFAVLNLRQVELTWQLSVVAMAVGVTAAVVASLIPAVRAAYEKPADAVRRVPKEPAMSHLIFHIAAVVALILVGMGLILVREHLHSKRLGTYGGLGMVMVGVLLAAPLMAHLLARALVPMARRFLPIAWRLAADNLVRAPGRTGLVIGALAAGVCLVVETSGIILSNSLAIREWVNTSIAADLIVTSGSPVGSGGQSTPMDESLGNELRKIPGVEAVLPVRMCKILVGERTVAVMTTDAAEAYKVEKDRLSKHPDVELLNRMAHEDNAVIVSENFAALNKIRTGDYIPLKSDQGEVKLHVIGMMVDYSWNLGTIMINRSDYVRHWKDEKVTVFDVYLYPGTDANAVKQKIASQPYDLHPLTRVELQGRIDDMIKQIYSIAYGQQIVVIVVAILGVVMTLLISVLQRRREMGLLRAIGASQAQVVYLVLAEAFLMGVLGTVLGSLFAIPLEWYALQVVFLEESGYAFPVLLPWVEIALIGPTALAVATLAGLGPALYSVRQRIPEAIAYE